MGDESLLYFEATLAWARTALHLHRHGVTAAEAFRAASAYPEFRPVAEGVAVLEASR